MDSGSVAGGLSVSIEGVSEERGVVGSGDDVDDLTSTPLMAAKALAISTMGIMWLVVKNGRKNILSSSPSSQPLSPIPTSTNPNQIGKFVFSGQTLSLACGTSDDKHGIYRGCDILLEEHVITFPCL